MEILEMKKEDKTKKCNRCGSLFMWAYDSSDFDNLREEIMRQLQKKIDDASSLREASAVLNIIKNLQIQLPMLGGANDQKTYIEKGFENEPKTCPACRQKSKMLRNQR